MKAVDPLAVQHGVARLLGIEPDKVSVKASMEHFKTWTVSASLGAGSVSSTLADAFLTGVSDPIGHVFDKLGAQRARL